MNFNDVDFQMLLFYLSLLKDDADKAKFTDLYIKYSKLMKYAALQKLDDENQSKEGAVNVHA